MRIVGGGAVLAGLALLCGCGYHIAGHANLMPKEVKTIAIPAFGNTTVNAALPRELAAAIDREFVSRTRFTIIADPDQADAVFRGVVLTFNTYPTTLDPNTKRATGGDAVVTLQLTLTDRHTGKVLFSRPNFEVHQRYEISIDPQTYFDESGTAIQRLSRDVARSVVSAVLEAF